MSANKHAYCVEEICIIYSLLLSIFSPVLCAIPEFGAYSVSSRSVGFCDREMSEFRTFEFRKKGKC
jgi:hypothetical protein